MIRRSERDSKWLLKHLTTGYIRAFPINHPEDFWWGQDNLWDWSIKEIAWRWPAIFFSHWLMGFVQLLLIPVTVHAFFYILRPDVIGFFDFLFPNRLSGYFFYFAVVGGAIGAVFGTASDYKKFQKTIRSGHH
jgi:hypothetical protein